MTAGRRRYRASPSGRQRRAMRQAAGVRSRRIARPRGRPRTATACALRLRAATCDSISTARHRWLRRKASLLQAGSASDASTPAIVSAHCCVEASSQRCAVVQRRRLPNTTCPPRDDRRADDDNAPRLQVGAEPAGDAEADDAARRASASPAQRSVGARRVASPPAATADDALRASAIRASAAETGRRQLPNPRTCTVALHPEGPIWLFAAFRLR